jgi:hypothetical protein
MGGGEVGVERLLPITVITVPNILDGRWITELFITVYYNFAKCLMWELEPDTEYDFFSICTGECSQNSTSVVK